MTQTLPNRVSPSPVPLDELDQSAKDFSQAVVLPAACYTDPAFFDFEMDAVFAKEWICTGRVDMVPNVGDYYTTTVLGEPLIVVRNRDAEVKVLSAVCRHRGMVITAPADRPEPEWTADPLSLIHISEP